MSAVLQLEGLEGGYGRLTVFRNVTYAVERGGTIGILVGAGISLLVRTLVPSIPATLSYLWIAIGFLISVTVGLFFGYYPASVAAKLDPIDCLRYE